jgi:UDP-glucuronate 4-epimerase
MALFLFAKAILEDRAIDVFNHGQMVRDFTYIDDIAEGVVRVLDRPAAADPAFDPAQPDPARSNSPYRVFNIGNSDPVRLMDFIEAIEQALGKPAVKNYMPLQDGDVPATFADVKELADWTGFKPATPVRDGVGRFVNWYRSYYRV